MIRMALKSLLHYRKNTGLSIGVIFVVVFLSVFVNTLSHTIKNDEVDRIKREYGYWQFVSEESRLIEGLKEGESNQVGEVETEGGSFIFSLYDEVMFELASLNMLDGRLPENEAEVIVDYSIITFLGYDYSLGQTIELEIDGYEYSGTLVGLYESIEGKWIQSSMVEKYPTIISTGEYSGGESLYYGFLEDERKINFLINNDEVNLISYPHLNLNWTIDDIQYHQEEALQAHNRNRTLNNSLIAFGLFIILNLFILNTQKVTLHVSKMKLMGVTNFNTFVYLLTTAIFYGVMTFILSFIAKELSLISISLFIRKDLVGLDIEIFNRSLKIQIISVVLLYLIMNIRSLHGSFIASTIIYSKKKVMMNKILKQVGYLVLFSLVVFFSFEKVLKITTKTLPDYIQKSKNVKAAASYTYRMHFNDVTLSDHQYDLSIHCSRLKSLDCGLTKQDIKKIAVRDDIESVAALSFTYVRPVTDESHNMLVHYEWPDYIEQDPTRVVSIGNVGILMYIFDDENAHYIPKLYDVELSEDFYLGKEGLLYLPEKQEEYNIILDEISYNNLSKLENEDIIKLGKAQTPIAIHKINKNEFNNTSNIEARLMASTLSHMSIFVHESYAEKLGLITLKYQDVLAIPTDYANYKETDRFVSAFGAYEHVYFGNHRMLSELDLMPVKTTLVSDLLQFLVLSIIGFGLIGSFIVADVSSQRKSIGLRRLMGETKSRVITTYMVSSTRSLLLAVVIALVSAISYSILNHKHYYNIYMGVLENSNPLGLKYMPLKEYIINFLTWNSAVKYLLLIVMIYIVLVLIVYFIAVTIIFRDNPLENLEERESQDGFRI